MILFLFRKDVRKEMMFLSLGASITALPIMAVYVQDWWHPLTVTNTAVGLEDIVSSFAIAGIAAVLYEEVFRKKVWRKHNVSEKKRNLNIAIMVSIMAVLFFGGFYILSLNSFAATVLALVVGLAIVYIQRPDLIKYSIASGFMMLFVAYIAYGITWIFTPDWLDKYMYFTNIPRVVLGCMALDDVIWFFLAGALIGPFYEYWQHGRFVQIHVDKD